MSENAENTSKPQGLCFVVMGFGKKTDYATGRLLDLDKSYEYLIKPVVENKGLECVRSSDIRHSGVIDLVMYQKLLTADVVIADLSTTNPNAIYELGIRHALRPWTTIVISEKELCPPFDLSHIVISRYTHMGDAIDYGEAMRFQGLLSKTLDQVLKVPAKDSPVYTSLGNLNPPYLEEEVAREISQTESSTVELIGGKIPETEEKTLAAYIREGEQAIDADQFERAKDKFRRALELIGETDAYLVQRLAFATCKSGQPDKVTAINLALKILDSNLHLKISNDPETVGLASTFESELFELNEPSRERHLANAIAYSARGYFLRSNRYNGITLALLLNMRTNIDENQEFKIADLVWANRIRADIVDLCIQELVESRQDKANKLAKYNLSQPDELFEELKERHDRREFWCQTAKAEAHFGLGQFDDYESARAEADKVPHAQWRWNSFEKRIKKLGDLLSEHGHLLNPPWPASKLKPGL